MKQYISQLSIALVLALGACECPGDKLGQGDGGDGSTSGDGALADGASNDGASGDGATNGDSSTVCERIVLAPSPKYPEVLIVQDISGSMSGTRWTNTKAALADVAMNLESRLRLGLYYYPEVDAPANNSCTLTDFASPTQYVDVAPALHTGTAITTSLATIDPYGGTPTPEALDQVVYPYLTMNRSGAPAGTPKYVILVTDGSPNCTQPGGDGDAVDHEVSQAATLLEVQQLYSAGIITYVVGYDIIAGVQDAMNGWAAAGHGQSTYINVSNQSTLTDAISDIADEIVPCDYELNMVPPNASYVSVKIDDAPIPLNGPNGWQLVGAKTVRLVGSACATLRDGGEHELDVAVECSIVIID